METIESEEDYFKALVRLEQIFDSKPNTPEGEEALKLTQLIDDWEIKNYPLD